MNNRNNQNFGNRNMSNNQNNGKNAPQGNGSNQTGNRNATQGNQHSKNTGQVASNNQKEQLINTAAQRLGTTPEQLKSAGDKGDIGKLLSNLTPEQASSLNKILGDKEAANKLLSTPQAQALLKKLSGK